MIPDVTRPCAFVFIREGDRMLVARMTDPSDGTIFHRPLGGGIGFGEVASDAARREIREELGAEIRRVRHLGVLEDVFTYDGRSGHEIAFIFEASPTDGRSTRSTGTSSRSRRRPVATRPPSWSRSTCKASSSTPRAWVICSRVRGRRRRHPPP